MNERSVGDILHWLPSSTSCHAKLVATRFGTPMPTRKTICFDAADRRQVGSPDGTIIFVLKKTKGGVHVERRQQVDADSCTGLTLVHSLFTQEADFARFCEADELRFQYPLTYKLLQREFSDLCYTDI